MFLPPIFLTFAQELTKNDDFAGRSMKVRMSKNIRFVISLFYEFRPSAATGCFRHGVSLHTSIVVKVDRGPHDSFLQPNRVHRHVERVITIFLCTWTVFIRRHLGGQPHAHFHLARMQRPDNDTISRDHRQ